MRLGVAWLHRWLVMWLLMLVHHVRWLRPKVTIAEIANPRYYIIFLIDLRIQSGGNDFHFWKRVRDRMYPNFSHQERY